MTKPKRKTHRTWQETFILENALDLLSLRNTLLKTPDISCFTYCIKEIVSICEVSLETKNREYFKLVDSFLSFMKTDIVFQNIDSMQYVNLLTNLTTISSDLSKVNVYETKSYFKRLLKVYRKQYLIELKNKIISSIINSDIEMKTLEKLTITTINELLSMGYTYKYLAETFKNYNFGNYENNVLENFESLITFLFEFTSDNYDIYLPIKEANQRDVNFVRSTMYYEQKIELGKEIKAENPQIKNLNDETYYCHVYFSYNDYYKGLEENIKRIRSIFNVLKFYTRSQIDFDMYGKTYIKSNKLNFINEKTITDILQFSIFQGTEQTIDLIQDNFKTLKENENIILEEIFNIMNYSQKDLDVFSVDQFVSKWISLETIAGKSETKKGFVAVLYYVPKFLTIAFFRQKLTTTLTKSYGYKNGMNLEKFINMTISQSKEEILSKIKNKYHKYLISNYYDVLTNTNKLQKQILHDKSIIEFYLYRIYMLRNRYVHLGDTSIYNDMIRYSLNFIEPFFIDRVLKSINGLMSLKQNNLTWDDAYTELDNKYDVLFSALKITIDELKISKDFIIRYSDLSQNKEHKNLIFNFILERDEKMFNNFKEEK